MGADRLNGLALLHVHRDIEISIDDIVDDFAIRHPQRMALNDVLNG